MSAMVGAWILPASMVATPGSVARRECCSGGTLPRSLLQQRRGFSRHERSSSRGVGRRWPRRGVVVTGALSTSGSPPGGGEPGEPAGGGLGSTRLGRLVSRRRRELLQRWNTARRNFPSKIFLLLFGFFFANALATILGQTGDWDVIAAGVLVAIIEAIGQLMYNRMPAFLGARGKATIELVNYWKIGFTFALFVDAFKVGS